MSWHIWARPCSFSYCTGISMANSLKKNWSKIRSFNWDQYVINGRKGYQNKNIACYLLINMHKPITNTWNLMIKIKNHFKYWDVKNLYGWTMSKKLLVYDFKWVRDNSEFNEDFMKSYNDENDEGYFLKLMFNNEDFMKSYNDENDEGYFLKLMFNVLITFTWFTLFAWKNEYWKNLTIWCKLAW